MKAFTAVLMLATAVMTAPAQAAETAANPTGLPSFDYKYDVSWGVIGVGTLNLRLQAQPGRSGCYHYSTTTDPNMLVQMVYGAPSQYSDFCLDNGQVRSQHFESRLPGDDKQSYSLDFNWSRHTVTDDKGRTRTIPDDAVDSLALQQAVRLWVLAHLPSAHADTDPQTARFTMVDNKHLTHYQFRFAGHKSIDTPAGHFDTLLMERIDTPGKIGRFWLAPSRGYMPVKSETKIGGKPAVTLVLDK